MIQLPRVVWRLLACFDGASQIVLLLWSVVVVVVVVVAVDG